MLYFGIIVLTILALLFAKVNGLLPERKVILLTIAIELLGVLIGAYDYYQNEVSFSGMLERPAAGEYEVKESLQASARQEESEWDVTVSPRQFEAERITELFDQAEQEIDATVLGRNASADEVTEALQLQDAYVDGNVEATWSFSDPTLISAKGELDYAVLESHSPSIVSVSAELFCGDQERVYTFPVSLVMPDASSQTGFSYYMAKAIRDADEADPTAPQMRLPEEVGHIPIQWSKQREYRGVWFCALGLLTGLGIVLGQREEKKRELLQRQKELQTDYPDIVSALSLYVSAGITVRAAFARITDGYRDRQRHAGIRDRPGYEAIATVVRQMEDGVGEEAAYGALATLTGHKDYGKLALMLTKNLRHGSVRLVAQLEKEEAQAFEARKLTARMRGEEASTKLLAPMLMLLAVVLVVLVAPAMFNLQM